MVMWAVALAVVSGSACPVALRYCSTYTFGAKLIMFCSPQPRGIRIRSSRPPMDGPRRSPLGQIHSQLIRRSGEAILLLRGHTHDLDPRPLAALDQVWREAEGDVFGKAGLGGGDLQQQRGGEEALQSLRLHRADTGARQNLRRPPGPSSC